MADKLIIVESPAKANTIKKFLGGNTKVVASMGHIRDLPKSKLGVNIENDFEPEYINIRGKGDLIKSLKKEAGKAKKVYLEEGQTDKPPQKELEKAAYVEREPRGRGCAWCNPDYHREQATAEGRFLLAYEPEEKLAMILDKETGAVEHMIFHCCPFCGRKLK